MSRFNTYLESLVKERTNKRFPAPKGFKKTYTGGNIYKYEGMLSNGKYVELFGEQDIQENDIGFDTGDTNVAHLYKSKDLENEDIMRESTFKDAEQLKAILDKWSK
jgi:hypothetical protein